MVTGTAFTTDLKPNDFIVVIVGGVTYTLAVKAIASATSLTLITVYGGPTATGNAWTAVPNSTLVGITAQIASDVAKAIRGLNLDKANWQQVFSGTGSITVTLPDGSTYTGPAWNGITNSLSGKADLVSGAVAVTQGGTGATSKAGARAALELKSAALGPLQTSITDTTDGAALVQGAYGLGPVIGTQLPMAQNTHFLIYGSAPGNSETSDSSLGAGVQVAYAPTRRAQYFIKSSGYFYSRFSLTAGVLDGSTAWNMHYTTQNTTKASTGVLSAASPVARIVQSKEVCTRPDIDEESFQWCGAGVANDEAEGITITRKDVGVYEISGSLGFAVSGWHLKAPGDPAGNGELGIVEGEQGENGLITVRLFKKRFKLNEETGDIDLIAGVAIDVPANSWIDVRMDMPSYATEIPISNEAEPSS